MSRASSSTGTASPTAPEAHPSTSAGDRDDGRSAVAAVLVVGLLSNYLRTSRHPKPATANTAKMIRRKIMKPIVITRPSCCLLVSSGPAVALGVAAVVRGVPALMKHHSRARDLLAHDHSRETGSDAAKVAR
jgi:hypothetical protein